MLDAIGKPASGMIEGSVTMFGNYDECLKIRVYHDDEDSYIESHEHLNPADHAHHAKPMQDESKEFFRGQYCVVHFKPWLPKRPPFYGMNSQFTVLSKNDDSVI